MHYHRPRLNAGGKPNHFILTMAQQYSSYLLFSFIFELVHNELAVSHKKKNLLRAIIPVITATLMVIACCYLYYLRRRKVANRQGKWCKNNHISKVVKIGILRRIVEGRWDRRSQDRIVNRKILHIFRFKAKNTLIITLYIE